MVTSLKVCGCRNLIRKILQRMKFFLDRYEVRRSIVFVIFENDICYQGESLFKLNQQ